jgi:hypothetical protein
MVEAHRCASLIAKAGERWLVGRIPCGNKHRRAGYKETSIYRYILRRVDIFRCNMDYYYDAVFYPAGILWVFFVVE